jgi:hypothetical protein
MDAKDEEGPSILHHLPQVAFLLPRQVGAPHSISQTTQVERAEAVESSAID